MFEQFEPAARQACFDARAEAGRAGQDKVGAEHMLLGLLAEPGPAADALTAAGLDLDGLRARIPRGDRDTSPDLDAGALATLGIDLDAVRRAADAAFGRGALDRAAGAGRLRLRFADDARQSLAGAVKQTHHLGQRQITTGHLLLGILDQKGNVAISVLSQSGTDLGALRADVLARLTAS
jgi:ATP-dependent Clp protease ATP-binding subunit ClpA